MNKKINKVAVIGSGIMGSRIACHFANIGVKVLLLDVTSDNKEFKNQIVDVLRLRYSSVNAMYGILFEPVGPNVAVGRWAKIE